eukprot:2323990-Amphidinium_carterae.2
MILSVFNLPGSFVAGWLENPNNSNSWLVHKHDVDASALITGDCLQTRHSADPQQILSSLSFLRRHQGMGSQCFGVRCGVWKLDPLENAVSKPGTSGGLQECIFARFLEANPSYPLKFVQFTNILDPTSDQEVYKAFAFSCPSTDFWQALDQSVKH